ncbi:MAG: DUF3185 domain-containing protein [Candidatus Eisenbacteria bacterium]|nr:DUF3185 domain-containing protein [Candidatus Eisenbacteria bacterium]
MKRMVGIALIAVGVIGIVWGGITYVKDRDTVDLGLAEVTVTEHDSVPIPPIASAIALIAGSVLLFTGRRQTA